MWKVLGMARKVIGKKLDAIMQPARASGASPFRKADKPATAGVSSLLSGNRQGLTSKDGGFPRWYLFGADLLLVAMALVVLYRSDAPFGGWSKVFGICAVSLGALLAVAAVCTKCSKGAKE